MTAGQDGRRANISGGAGPPPLGAGTHRGIHWLGQGVRSPWEPASAGTRAGARHSESGPCLCAC